MAARKSCTHMTWAQAKSKSGGGDHDRSRKKKTIIQVTHGQALTAKIVRKHSAPPEFTQTELRRARKQEEKALALADKISGEREAERRERESRTVCPLDVALGQVEGEALRRQKRQTSADTDAAGDGGRGMSRSEIAQCREMQLDEIEALDAIYAGSDEYRLRDDANVELLRSNMDAWQETGDEAVLDDIVQHPLLAFTLRLSIEDENDVLNAGSAGIGDPVATALLEVVLPAAYPEAALPRLAIAYFAVTDRAAQISADKALESLVHLEEERLVQELREEARRMVPMPCVYELATTWLTEHVFQFCRLRTHAQIG